MTGVEDLDRNGRWEQNPEYGAVWIPLQVSAGWAPYPRLTVASPARQDARRKRRG